MTDQSTIIIFMERTCNTKERLIDAATRLIWEKSYNTVSVDRICKEAGVNKGSFYYFFPSKESLALEALDSLWEKSKDKIFKPAFSSGLPPLERFNRFFSSSFKVHFDKKRECGGELGCPFGNLGSEVGVDEEVLRNKVSDVYKEIGAYFESALLDGIECGVIHCDSPASTAQSLVALQSGVLLLGKINNDIEVLRLFIPGAAGLIGADVLGGLLVPALKSRAG